ncbi:hypothetical protein Tco_1500585 [Tanacetum coccineum]
MKTLVDSHCYGKLGLVDLIYIPGVDSYQLRMKDILIRASRLRKILYEAMTGLVSEKYVENAHNESSLSITSNDINVELNKEFLVELQKNAYHGTLNEDVVDHIAKVLEMVDLIYIPSVDSHQLRIKFFSLLLAGNAKEWWTNEGEGKITTWEELVEKFFCRMRIGIKGM